MLIQVRDKYKHVLDMTPEDVDIKQVAGRLSRICRFDGRIDKFYSVAEHAVRLSQFFDGNLALAIEAQHHDDHEAFIGDMITPQKQMMSPEWHAMERHAATQVRIAAGVSIHLDPTIQEADKRIAATEARDLRVGFDPGEHGWADPLPNLDLTGFRVGWTPKLAERFYLFRHHELERRKNEL